MRTTPSHLPRDGPFNRVIRLAVVLALPIAGVLTSCTQPTENATTAASVPTTAPAAHWVQDQRLRQVMDDLVRKLPTWPHDIPQEPEQKEGPAANRQFDEVAALAGTLAVASERIPDLAVKLKMAEADRAGFIAEAGILHQQATQLRDSATARKIERMQRAMDGINSTCISCHSRYRDFSGELHQLRALGPNAGLDSVLDMPQPGRTHS